MGPKPSHASTDLRSQYLRPRNLLQIYLTLNSPVPPCAESSRPAPWSMDFLAVGTPAPPTPTTTGGAPLGASIAACPPCTSQGAMEPGGL